MTPFFTRFVKLIESKDLIFRKTTTNKSANLGQLYHAIRNILTAGSNPSTPNLIRTAYSDNNWSSRALVKCVESDYYFFFNNKKGKREMKISFFC